MAALLRVDELRTERLTTRWAALSIDDRTLIAAIARSPDHSDNSRRPSNEPHCRIEDGSETAASPQVLRALQGSESCGELTTDGGYELRLSGAPQRHFGDGARCCG